MNVHETMPPLFHLEGVHCAGNQGRCPDEVVGYNFYSTRPDGQPDSATWACDWHIKDGASVRL